MEKQLKNLNKDMDQLLLKNIKVSSEEKDRILQGIQAKKRRKSPLGYYSALVAAAAIICLFTLSQLDFLKKDPGMSDDDPPVVEPDKEGPVEIPVMEEEEKSPPVQEEEEEPVEEVEEDYTSAPLFYITEAGEFKLKKYSNSPHGIGIGDSMEEVLEIFGEPDYRSTDEANPDSEVFNYSKGEFRSLAVVFTEGPDPVVDFINSLQYKNPISPDSFSGENFGKILDLHSNINVYGDEDILFYEKEKKYGNHYVKLLNKSNHPDEASTIDAYDAIELTLEEFLDKIIDPVKEIPTGTIKDEETPQLIETLFDSILFTFQDIGKKNDWSYHDNPADFEILRPELRKYASEAFTEGKLKELSDLLYRGGTDARLYPTPYFNARYLVQENTSDRIVVSSLEFGNELSSGGTTYFTAIHEDGKWVLDHWEIILVDEKPLNITWEEYEVYQGGRSTLINQVSHNNDTVFVYYFEEYDSVGAVYASNSKVISDVPSEWIPEKYRKN